MPANFFRTVALKMTFSDGEVSLTIESATARDIDLVRLCNPSTASVSVPCCFAPE